jgi:hypothetical protein
MDANGNAKDVKLSKISPEEQEEALRILSEIEAEIEADKSSEDNTPAFELDEETTKKVRVKLDGRVLQLINATDVRRNRLEEVRANHRNFNRMMTLAVAIVLGFAVTYGLTNNLVPDGKALGPYSFCITVLLDTALAAYALVKHY